MNIVEPSTEDLTLDQAVQLTGRGAKTLRRAVQAGELPRRYVMSPRGPQLVFARGAVEHWMGEKGGPTIRRGAQPAGQPAPLDPDPSALTAARVAYLQHAVAVCQVSIEQTLIRLTRQQALLSELTQRILELDAKGEGSLLQPPVGEGTPAPV